MSLLDLYLQSGYMEDGQVERQRAQVGGSHNIQEMRD